MKERLFNLLNLKVSESNHVFDLLRIQLFIGIANSFINIAAFTFFIYKFSIELLPYNFLAVAGVLFSINLFYEKLEHRLSPTKLLSVIIVFSAAVLLLFWVGLIGSSYKPLIFLLLIWSTVFYMVTGYAYWGLVSLLFNVRESKRVFSIVGAGDIPSKLIGYLSAPLLIPLIGISNLLFVALVSLGISYWLVRRLMTKQLFSTIKIKHHQSHVNEEPQRGIKKVTNHFFFKHKLIFTISILSLLSYNVFNFVDFTFIAEVKVKYKDLSSLAFFIAMFFGIGRVAALVLKLVFTSRVIERLGTIACLLITPAILFALSMVSFLLPEGSFSTLYFFGVMAVATEVLRSTIQEPAFFILFQPLNEHYRLKGHILAKGYMLPPSLIVVGLSLIAMQQTGFELTISTAVKIILANVILWSVIVVYIKREYIRSLHRSIARGVFSGEDVHIYDRKTIDILLAKTGSENESEVIYALKHLESAQYRQIDELFISCLHRPQRNVKRFALYRLDERKQLDKQVLEEMLNTETDNQIIQQLVLLLTKMDSAFLQKMSDKLNEFDYSIRRIVITRLLDQREFEYLFKAANEINNLMRSEKHEERELALEIMSELKNINFTDAIKQLLFDENTSVKRAAITAACKLKNKNLLPTLVDLMELPGNRFIVLQGMVQYGDKLFEDIMTLPEEQVERNLVNFIKLASKFRGVNSTKFLLHHINNTVYQERLIYALWSKGYQAETVEDIYQFQHLLSEFLKTGVEKISYYGFVLNDSSRVLIKSSLESEIRNDLITSLRICSLLFHKAEINRVLELIENGDTGRIYNAMEMLEMVLPKKTAKQLINLLELILDASVRKPKTTIATKSEFFRNVLRGDESKFNSWTKSICLYTCLANKDYDLLKEVELSRDPGDSFIIAETKQHILHSLKQVAYADY